MEDNFCWYSSGRGLLSKIWEGINELTNKRVNDTISKWTVEFRRMKLCHLVVIKREEEGAGIPQSPSRACSWQPKNFPLKLPLKPLWPLDGTKPLAHEPSEDTQGPSCSNWTWAGASGHWDWAPGTGADGYQTIVQGLRVRCTGLSGLPAVCAPTLEVLSLTDWVAEWNSWPLWMLTFPLRLGADEMRPTRGA